MRSSRSNRRAYPASADLAPVSSGSSSRGRNETPTGDRRCHVWAAGCRGLGRPRGRLEVGRGGVSSREMTELSSGARSSRVRGRARDGARARLLAGNCRGPAGEIRFSRDAPCRVSAGPGGRVCAHPRSTARLRAEEESGDERQSVARASTSRAESLTEVVRGKRTTTACPPKITHPSCARAWARRQSRRGAHPSPARGRAQSPRAQSRPRIASCACPRSRRPRARRDRIRPFRGKLRSVRARVSFRL